MDELDKYECFGVPAHVWVETDEIVVAPRSVAPRRNGVPREAAMLGAEAIPSPGLTGSQTLK
jgi:hypothetical protein